MDRIEELTCEYLEEKKLLAAAQADQETHEKQIDSFRKVVNFICLPNEIFLFIHGKELIQMNHMEKGFSISDA